MKIRQTSPIFSFTLSVVPVSAALVGAVQAAEAEPSTAPDASGVVERRVVMVAVEPVRIDGNTYMAASMVSLLLKAQLRWHAADRVVEIGRNGRVARFRLGSRMATINNQRVRLRASPFLKDGNAMIPLSSVARALGVPVNFNSRTDSIEVKSKEDTPGARPRSVLWTMPLLTTKTGIVLHSPKPDTEWHRTVRVQGQANLFGDSVVVQLLSANGVVLLQSEGIPFRPGTKGTFREFVTLIGMAKAPGKSYPALIRAFSANEKNGRPFHSVTVPITFHEQ